jgi:hypothetical protein
MVHGQRLGSPLATPTTKKFVAAAVHKMVFPSLTLDDWALEKKCFSPLVGWPQSYLGSQPNTSPTLQGLTVQLCYIKRVTVAGPQVYRHGAGVRHRTLHLRRENTDVHCFR